jgi:hypothetical protein
MYEFATSFNIDRFCDKRLHLKINQSINAVSFRYLDPLLGGRSEAFIGVTITQSFSTGRNWQTETWPFGQRQNTVKFSPVVSMTTSGSPPSDTQLKTKSFAFDTPWLRGDAPAEVAKPPKSSTATANTIANLPIVRIAVPISCLLSSSFSLSSEVRFH